jgi:serine/threonine protein kinase/Rieske Fe-S protein
MQQTLSADELVGKIIGTYRVECLLGRGRLSAVYLARHSVENSTAALTTILLPEHFSPEARSRFIARFTKEALALTQLQHSHILPVYAYGEQYGYPYLITPYMMHGSLADILKQQGHCTLSYVQRILEQVAAGLEYAHSKGIIHGTLKPANILLSGEQTILVAGFGLMQIVQRRGLEQNDPPNAHLLSIANTFLGAPEYLAPEVVQGQPIDMRSDIYALGCILFELLSGKPPFSGASSFDIALQHVQQQLPSLRRLSPDIPIALESVINQALARDPSQRFQLVSELAEAFAQVYRGTMGNAQPQTGNEGLSGETETDAKTPLQTQGYEVLDMPAEDSPTGSWQLMPPIVTGKTAVVHSLLKGPQAKVTGRMTGEWQLVPPIVTGHLPVVEPSASAPAAQQSIQLPDAVPMVQVDNSPASPSIAEPASGASDHTTEAPTLVKVNPPRRMSRRAVSAMLVTAGVAVAGALVVGGIDLAHLLHSTNAPSPTQGGNGTHPTGGGTQTQPGKGTPAHTPTMKSQVPHTGTVVGSTSLAINTSVEFANPLDGKASLLIHLPGNNNFVAYERACTHQGVAVHYDAATHTLVCPAHGSVFDPANGGKVLQGPAARPLPSIVIHVNADGTITAG